MKQLERNAVIYLFYLCSFVIVAVLAWRYEWDIGFPLLFFAGVVLLTGVSRFASYEDRHPQGAPDEKPLVQRLLRWSPLLFALLTALPPIWFILFLL